MATASQPRVSEDRNLRLQALWRPDGMLAGGRNTPLLAASMVCADPLHMAREIRFLEEGEVDLLHFDIMDGVFVPRLGLGPELLKAARQATELPIDVHLMLSDAEGYIPAFAEAGADIIIVHAEASNHLPRLLALIRRCGARAGVALNPSTPSSVLTYVLDEIDLLLLMTVNPGSYGEKLMPAAMRKMADVRTQLGDDAERVHILIDGNVTADNSPDMVRAGASILVCGSSSIFDQDANVRDSLRSFRRGLEERLGAAGPR